MIGKPRVVTFRLDQATWDFMRELVPYTKYRNTSSFIRAAHPYLPQSQTLRIIFATACQETFFSSLLVDYPVRQQTTKAQIETKLCRSALS